MPAWAMGWCRHTEPALPSLFGQLFSGFFVVSVIFFNFFFLPFMLLNFLKQTPELSSAFLFMDSCLIVGWDTEAEFSYLTILVTVSQFSYSGHTGSSPPWGRESENSSGGSKKLQLWCGNGLPFCPWLSFPPCIVCCSYLCKMEISKACSF